MESERKYRYVMGTCHDPYYNLALEETLFPYADEETILIYLWQNENTIVIGRNQDVYAECRAEAFLRQKGKIARRKSGGGAVYHDLGNLCFSIISRKEDVAICDYRILISRALARFGIAAEPNGRNDLVLHGKKFSGNAKREDGRIVCQHGTILIHTDIEKMNGYLTPAVPKLERNHVESVASRVMNLSEVSDRITVREFCSAFIEACGMQPLPTEPDERKVCAGMRKYADKEWIFRGKMK